MVVGVTKRDALLTGPGGPIGGGGPIGEGGPIGGIGSAAAPDCACAVPV